MTEKRDSRPALVAAALTIALMAGPIVAAREVVLASGGKAKLPILLARGASEAERLAARDLAAYLGRVTGARFRIKRENPGGRFKRAIYVGGTSFAAGLGIDDARLRPEAWRIVGYDGSLILAGGSPRGTLYAIYRFLEDWVGVHWWTPWEEVVPLRAELTFGPVVAAGEPAFAYRDIHGIGGPLQFRLRNRINGHFSFLPQRFGGRESYGPPDQVHNLYRYIPPDEYFAAHPEYYSLVNGSRVAERAQLCLTNDELQRLVGEKLRGYIEDARADARRDGEPPPKLFAISQNDWSGPCSCESCRAMLEREGSYAGALVEFVNRAAAAVAEDYPDVRVDTLAYGHTFDPPRQVAFEDNVSLRLAALYDRDFSKPITDPVHRRYREAIDGWRTKTKHLRIWDYVVTFGDHANLPLPNLGVIAGDLSYHLDHGVEGVFIQTGNPILADLRDLKLWLTIKLVEDPRTDLGRRVEEFTDGYYGAGGAPIREYLRLLEQAAARRPASIHYPAEPGDFVYLDREFIFAAHEQFDLAEGRTAPAPRLHERVRRARIALDRATVLLWEDRFGLVPRASDGAGRELALRPIAERCRETVLGAIAERVPERQRAEYRRQIERELGAVVRRFVDLETDGPH